MFYSQSEDYISWRFIVLSSVFALGCCFVYSSLGFFACFFLSCCASVAFFLPFLPICLSLHFLGCYCGRVSIILNIVLTNGRVFVMSRSLVFWCFSITNWICEEYYLPLSVVLEDWRSTTEAISFMSSTTVTRTGYCENVKHPMFYEYTSSFLRKVTIVSLLDAIVQLALNGFI